MKISLFGFETKQVKLKRVLGILEQFEIASNSSLKDSLGYDLKKIKSADQLDLNLIGIANVYSKKRTFGEVLNGLYNHYLLRL